MSQAQDHPAKQGIAQLGDNAPLAIRTSEVRTAQAARTALAPRRGSSAPGAKGKEKRTNHRVNLNQYQGGMCISGVLPTTERTPRQLISPLGPNWVGTDCAV